MSNDVRGYIELSNGVDVTPLKTFIEKKYDIGIGPINSDELYNFPPTALPDSNKINFIFAIGDDNEYYNASYLIDYMDYAPEADIGFPTKAKDRLNILLDTLVDLIKITHATKMMVALTECNQIETIKKIKLSELYDVIHADFEEYQAPPDTLYEITV